MKMFNICRAITFYNNYVPPKSRNQEQDWEFCAFGTVDSIKVEKNILGDEVCITESIWKKQKEFCASLKGNYAARQIYAIRYDDPEIEDGFWEDQSNEAYPFFFFCQIQCDENKLEVYKNRALLEKALQIEEKTRALIYLTYDNSDLLLVLRAANYNIGAALINSLHQNANMSMNNKIRCTIKNSYTTFAVKYSWICDYVLENKSVLNCETIDTVRINFIEKRGGSVAAIVKEIGSRLNIDFQKEEDKRSILCVPVLGEADDVVTLSGIGWGDFLALYCKKTGLFANNEQIFYNNVSGITTHIEQNLPNIADVLNDNGISFVTAGSDSDSNWSAAYVKRVDKLVELLEKANKFTDLKEISIILNTLYKFNGEAFSDYVFFPVLEPLTTLLELLAGTGKEGQNRNRVDKEPVYYFLRRFSIYAQNSAISDRYSTQMLNFNTKIYDIPIKLSAFYNAYLYNVKNILNIGGEAGEQNNSGTGENHSYSFFMVPGMNDYVNIIELYKRVSDNKRLMSVQMPEYSAYKLHETMLILTHEAAHYVGSIYRDRETRHEALLKSYAHIFTRYIKYQNHEQRIFNESVEERLWKEIEKRMELRLSDRIDYEKNKNYILGKKGLDLPENVKDDIADNNFYYSDYNMSVIMFTRIAMFDIITCGLGDIFDPILYRLEEDERQEAEKVLREVAEVFMMTYPEGSTRLNSDTTLESLKRMYEESFADLMAISILNLDVKDYINCVIDNAKHQGMDIGEILRSEMVFRLMAVIIVVVNEETDLSAKWCGSLNADNLKPGSDQREEWCYVGRNIIKILRNMDTICADKETQYGINALNAFKDKEVVQYLTHYLSVCKRNFDKSYHIENNEDEAVKRDKKKREKDLIKIREVFRECAGWVSSSGEEQIIKMEKFIQDYKEDVLSEV